MDMRKSILVQQIVVDYPFSQQGMLLASLCALMIVKISFAKRNYLNLQGTRLCMCSLTICTKFSNLVCLVREFKLMLISHLTCC